MQNTSDAYKAAMAHRTWVPVRLRTDWAGDGYDGDGSIDDLSPQMQAGWEVDHTLDDGYPETVAFVSGTNVPEFSTNLTGRADTTTGAPITTPAYWSPLRTDSPVHGFDRDVAPVTVDTGVVTANGVERVRVFTGQMANVRLNGGQASLSTISATRMKLMKLVQPPAFSAQYSGGLTAAWPVSYCLTACGLYAGALPRSTGTAWYVPMHGSAWEMLPQGNRVYTATELLDGADFPYWNAYEQTPADSGPVLVGGVDWVEGPYVSAPDLQLTASMRRALYQNDVYFDPASPDVFSQAGRAARLEMWVRGDATNVNNAPGGSATVTRLCSLWAQHTLMATFFRMGINTSRKVEVMVNDGANIRTLTSTASLPTDGAWHFVGVAFDMVAQRLWVNLDGVVETSNPSLTSVNLPAVDAESWISGDPVFLSVLPVSDITVTSGVQANPTNYPLWRNDASFAPTARVFHSKTYLECLAEPEPREAWQMITEYAQGELASARLTETDGFEYLPPGWWVRDEQQVVVEAFDTATNAEAFDVDLDPTKVRNAIKVTYSEVTVFGYDIALGGFQPIFEMSSSGTPVEIGRGVSVIRFVYSGRGIMPAQRFELASNTPLAYNASFVCLCDSADGIGTYAADSQVVVTLEAWDAGSATVRFQNLTSLSWFIVNDADFAPMTIVGLPVTEASTYVLDRDETSIASPTGNPRGERSLDVSAPAVQTMEAARRLARRLKMALRYPVATIGADQQGVTVTADPSRQPGDLVTFRDRETGVDGAQWRLRGVHHRGGGPDYTQAVVARHVQPIMIIGTGLVGESLIGPTQD